MAWTLSEIVARLGGELHGEDRSVARLAPLDEAGADEIAFVTGAKHADALRAKRREVLAHFDGLTQSIFHDMFSHASSAAGVRMIVVPSSSEAVSTPQPDGTSSVSGPMPTTPDVGPGSTVGSNEDASEVGTSDGRSEASQVAPATEAAKTRAPAMPTAAQRKAEPELCARRGAAGTGENGGGGA